MLQANLQKLQDVSKSFFNNKNFEKNFFFLTEPLAFFHNSQSEKSL